MELSNESLQKVRLNYQTKYADIQVEWSDGTVQILIATRLNSQARVCRYSG